MNTANVAENLTGYTLPGGWRVRDKVARQAGDTGGNFSVNYLVEREGQQAFCKVLNYAWIMQARAGVDPTGLLQEAVSTYNFERDIARQCASLPRVVTAIDDGNMNVTDYSPGLVSYIIFEMADKDVRRMLNETEEVEAPIKLRLLHDLATGLRQLHTRGISHQDVKPSNLLIFGIEQRQESGKIGDLGRVITSGTPGPYDDLDFAGDLGYAPPEALYHGVLPGFAQCRLAADIYQLGGMISFCFSAMPINAHLIRELHPRYHWQHWPGTFDEVLPYVSDAMGRAIASVEDVTPHAIRDDVGQILRQLCEPDPARRGDITRIGRLDQYSLTRFVTRLDLLERRARLAASRS